MVARPEDRLDAAMRLAARIRARFPPGPGFGVCDEDGVVYSFERGFVGKKPADECAWFEAAEKRLWSKSAVA